MTTSAQSPLPKLTPGLTLLQSDDPRTGAIHRLAAATTAEADGDTYWIDARSTASTYAFGSTPERSRALASITVARAFTAYQHHTLVHELDGRIDDDTVAIVLPCLGALYADDDVPDPQASALFADVLDAIDALVACHDVAVLTTAATAPFAEAVSARADRTIAATETPFGTAFEAPSFQTTVYHGPGFWQTTIPYWVDLLGETAAIDATVEPIHRQLGALG